MPTTSGSWTGRCAPSAPAASAWASPGTTCSTSPSPTCSVSSAGCRRTSSSRCSSAWPPSRPRWSAATSARCCCTPPWCGPRSSTSPSPIWCVGWRRTPRARTSCPRSSTWPTAGSCSTGRRSASSGPWPRSPTRSPPPTAPRIAPRRPSRACSAPRTASPTARTPTPLWPPTGSGAGGSWSGCRDRASGRS
ncbi:Uncharacterised protein [Mycobacteroides abscessus subsp. abscessus]|nr:Uncharacterised protein [Mycobacteroides abscessus subsp. abscessus]